MTHHLQRDLDFVDEVTELSNKQRMTLVAHDEHNICRDAVWSLKVKYSKMIRWDLFLKHCFVMSCYYKSFCTKTKEVMETKSLIIVWFHSYKEIC